MYNLRLRDRFKRYSGLSTQSSSKEKFLRNEKRTSESKGLLCSSQTEWEEIHIGYVFIFISRLRNYSNTPVCAHLFPQGTYKRTKIIPSLARNSSDRVGSQKTGKKGHTAIRQERLGSHRASLSILQRALEGLLESVHQRRNKSEVNVKDAEGVVSKVIFNPVESQKWVRRTLCRLVTWPESVLLQEPGMLVESAKGWRGEGGHREAPPGSGGVRSRGFPKALGMHARNSCWEVMGGLSPLGRAALPPGPVDTVTCA